MSALKYETEYKYSIINTLYQHVLDEATDKVLLSGARLNIRVKKSTTLVAPEDKMTTNFLSCAISEPVVAHTV